MQWRSLSIVKYKSSLITQWWSNINNSPPSTPSGTWKYVYHLYPYILLLNYTMQGLHVHSGLTRTQSPWHFTKHSTSEINHILKPLKPSALTKQPSIHPFWYLEVHYILLLHHAMQGLHSTLTSTQLPWHFTTSVRQNLIQTTSYNQTLFTFPF